MRTEQFCGLLSDSSLQCSYKTQGQRAQTTGRMREEERDIEGFEMEKDGAMTMCRVRTALTVRRVLLYRWWDGWVEAGEVWRD